MGYQIRYGPVGKVRYGEKRRSRLLALIGLFFLAFLVLVHLLWPEGSAFLWDLTRSVWSRMFAAVEAFAEELQIRTTLFEAAEAFFCTIVEYDSVFRNS